MCPKKWYQYLINPGARFMCQAKVMQADSCSKHEGFQKSNVVYMHDKFYEKKIEKLKKGELFIASLVKKNCFMATSQAITWGPSKVTA